jgi:hypothetical protein
MGAGAAGEDVARVQHLVEATEMTRILIDESDHFVEQLGIGEDGAAAKIDEPLVGAVALRPPAVLVDQHARIDAPALVLALEPPQHA